MKTMKLKMLAAVLTVLLCAATFAACNWFGNGDGNNDNPNTFNAGIYNGVQAGESQSEGAGTEVDMVAFRLSQITAPSFTVDGEGVASSITFGSGGTSFFTHTAANAATKYRFYLSGGALEFQVNPYSGGQNGSYTGWVNWNTQSNSDLLINTVNYKRSIAGTFNSTTGGITLVLKYTTADGTKWVSQNYEFTKQA